MLFTFSILFTDKTFANTNESIPDEVLEDLLSNLHTDISIDNELETLDTTNDRFNYIQNSTSSQNEPFVLDSVKSINLISSDEDTSLYEILVETDIAKIRTALHQKNAILHFDAK